MLVGLGDGAGMGASVGPLVGPFVGFHHQALLIACFWPDGKGNIGYGANVGSNHTLKAPDQELWPGEGCFFCRKPSIRAGSASALAPAAPSLPSTTE